MVGIEWNIVSFMLAPGDCRASPVIRLHECAAGYRLVRFPMVATILAITGVSGTPSQINASNTSKREFTGKTLSSVKHFWLNLRIRSSRNSRRRVEIFVVGQKSLHSLCLCIHLGYCHKRKPIWKKSNIGYGLIWLNSKYSEWTCILPSYVGGRTILYRQFNSQRLNFYSTEPFVKLFASLWYLTGNIEQTVLWEE